MKNFLRSMGVYIVPPVVYLLMRIIWYTTFKKFHFISPVGDEQHVCVAWHSELFMTPQAYRHIHKTHPASAIISEHFDGTLISNILNMFSISSLRGSSTRGAKRVLMQAFKCIKSGQEVLITPDGPRGPRHSISDGVVGIAQKSKLPVFIINYQSSNYWQLDSWDKFVIPKPFCRIDFYIQSLSLEGMNHKEAKDFLSSAMLEYTIL